MRSKNRNVDAKRLRLLIVEDDSALASTLGEWFTLDGHSCDYAADGYAAMTRIESDTYDVMLLDVSLPRIDGLEVARRMREQGNATPILMLTSRDAVEDRVLGLDSGADDYVVKPFALAEVAARIRVLSKRRTGLVQRLNIGPLELLLDEKRVRRDGVDIDISPIGWCLLETLVRSSPSPVDRAILSYAAWGDEPPKENNLKVQMFKLRQVIDKPFNTALIQTVKGRGYRIDVNYTSSK